MYTTCLKRVRQSGPLVHCITNYVTVNDCANILLAVGASPIMADEPAEVAEITSICNSLIVNIGTLNAQTVPSMFAAGYRAVELGHPVVFDPVGAGASKLRTDTALKLIEELPFTVVRGNISEIQALTTGASATQGVDANISDLVGEDNLDEAIGYVQASARKLNTILAVSGPIDLISDGQKCMIVRNGHPMMSRITGTGCMLTALTAAFLAANPGDYSLEAVTTAFVLMGLAGQKATENGLGECKRIGTGSFRTALIDAVSMIEPDELERNARVEIR